MFTRLARIATIAIGSLALASCGINSVPTKEEAAKAQWGNVENALQRRADLIPNLVQTVQGYAAHEKGTLTALAEARSRAGSIQVTPELARDPKALQAFQAAQGELSGALSRLLAISENYPQLKADQGFRDLQAQLEGTENRIAVARNRYIAAIRDYNVTTRQFPTNLTAKLFGLQARPNFSVENEKAISAPPAVQFGSN